MIVLTDKHKIPFQIDEQYLEAVSQYSWYISTRGYPATHVGKGAQETMLELHLFLFGRAPNGLKWDHENRDKLDNRKANLRPVTSRENNINTAGRRTNTSGATGVRREQRTGKWTARIKDGKGGEQHLGTFVDFADAVAARHRAEAIRSALIGEGKKA